MKSFLKRNGAWIGFFLLALIMTVLTDGQFASSRNLTNLVKQTTINGILASGMTMVILTGGIDLSVGSTVALAGIVAGISQVHWGWAQMGAIGAAGTILVTLGCGGLLGFVTGGLVALLGIAPFVITLGMMVINRGLAMILSQGGSISPMGDSLVYLSGGYLSFGVTLALLILLFSLLGWTYRRNWSESLFPFLTMIFLSVAFLSYRGFPLLAIFLIVSLATIGFLLKYTPFGRSVYAIGSNDRASFWAGVAVRKVRWWVYALTGLLAGLSGLLLTARLNGADPNAGQLFELDAIAAVVIGGTSLKGGVGTITGSFVGALLIATLNNGMDLMGVPSFYQMVLKGVIIIAAVGLDKGQRQTL